MMVDLLLFGPQMSECLDITVSRYVTFVLQFVMVSDHRCCAYSSDILFQCINFSCLVFAVCLAFDEY